MELWFLLDTELISPLLVIVIDIIVSNFMYIKAIRHRAKNIPKSIIKGEGLFFFFDKLTFEGIEAPYLL
ncbi:hypothetical protein BCY91_05545 [Pelobium manganitolerans]|uniref:Uncharacterized protein n=1 Tax=Pelobium manganitolerans TaxID=1842495 RepID=A0A419S6A0_9SPHI|nr:hypothetical protein BCY91_05545 [Pelobium manganitolerans]